MFDVHTHTRHLQQVTILRETLQGFVFESNRGTRVSMTANTSLGPQFNFGWNNKKGKKFKSKTDITKDKVSVLQSLFLSLITLPPLSSFPLSSSLHLPPLSLPPRR